MGAPKGGVGKDVKTFVFEEVAHSSSPAEDELGYVFDDLCFFFGREGRKPFG